MAEPWSDTNVLTAADLAGLPWGVMGYVLGSTSDQTGITAEVDITSLSITFTAVSSRLYRTTLRCSCKQLTNAAEVTLAITDAANTNLRRAGTTLPVNAIQTIMVELIETGLSGSITRKARAFSGASSLTIPGASNYRPSFIVEDLGPG